MGHSRACVGAGVLFVGFVASCIEPPRSAAVEQAVGSVQTVHGYNTQIDGREQFGDRNVALSADGSTLAVGATGESSCATGINGTPSICSMSSGAVYVFTRVGGTWTQEAFIKASVNRTAMSFGFSVALSSDGNTLAVGAIGDSSAATGVDGSQLQGDAPNAGAVFVFSRSHRGWQQQAYIKASNTADYDGFGYRVAVSGDGSVLVATSPFEQSNATGINGNQQDNSLSAAGAAYVYARSGQRWVHEAYVKASNTQYEAHFGYSVAVAGDGATFAIGVTHVDGGDNPVYVFSRDRRGIRQTAYVRPSSSPAPTSFGTLALALDASGTRLAAGSTGENAGAVRLFELSASGWTERAVMTAANGDVDDELGFSLAMSEDAVVAGAIGESSANASDPLDNTAPVSGAAYVFSGLAAPAQTDYLKSPTIAQYTQYGRSVAISSDASVVAVSQPFLGGGVVHIYGP
jgi:hypothetical protein